MALSSLVSAHGYWLLAVGCLLEGETLLIMAGFAAHQGYLNLWAVLAVAATAGFLGDQACFWLGRWQGRALLARWPVLARHATRVQRLLERYHEAMIIGVRFAYGLRLAGPVLIGTSSIRAVRFVVFNALGAMLWAVLVAGVGWVFGLTAEWLLGEMHRYEIWLLLVLLVVLAGVALWRYRYPSVP